MKKVPGSIIMKITKKIAKEQSGSILVIVALAMTALLGISALVVDAGLLYFERLELQNAADSAALAGAKELPMDSYAAKDKAEEYLEKNGVYNDDEDQESDHIEVSVASDNKKITVIVTREVPLYLARVLNILSADVSAKAASEVAPFAGGDGALPFGVPEDSIVPEGEEFTLKEGAEDQLDTPQPGWYYYYLKGGTSELRDWIENGYPEVVEVKDVHETSQGNKTAALEAAAERIQKGDTEVIVPIITRDTEIDLGNKEWKIVSFAVLELVEVTELNPQGEPTGQSELIASFCEKGQTVAGRADKSGKVKENGLWATWLAE